MKKRKIIAALMIIAALAMLTMSCSKSSATTSTTTKTATVQKGNLSVSITGTGNLAYSKTEDMAFEMAGYVAEVLVKAGDTVKKGDEIARLNTSDWEDKIKTLTKTLTSAQRGLTTAQEAVTKAERSLVTAQGAVTTAQRNVDTREFAVQQTELSLKTAEYNLSELADVKTAQDIVDAAKNTLDVARAMRSAGDSTTTTAYLQNLESEYETALKRLEKVRSGSDPTTSAGVALKIAEYQFDIQQATRDVEDAKISVEDAKTAVTNAQLDQDDTQTAVINANLDLTEAEQTVQDAQANLDETKALSPIVTAPFDGFITSVKASGGDEVFKGSIAAVISDPEQFEADILVTENDIFSVKVGGEATVSLDALSDVTYPAKITFISPTATVSSGVVNYSVTVELTSLTPTSTAATTTIGQAPAGALPSGTTPAGFSPPAGTPAASAATGATATAVADTTINLKEGLSATVKIISEQANNVLIIPAKAISTQGQKSTVQVLNGTVSETRTVTVGMTDGTNTEIRSGLSEGEEVTYKTSSSASSTRTTTQQGGGGILGGGPPGGF